MLILGNKEISFVALGDTEISSAYKGNTEVYANANDNMPPFVASEWSLYGDAEAWNYSRTITVTDNQYQTNVYTGGYTGGTRYTNFTCTRIIKNKDYKSCVIQYSNSGKASSWTQSGYGDTFIIQGSNDGTSWTNISSQNNSGKITSGATVTLAISGNYTYLRYVHKVTSYMYNDDSGRYYTTVKSIEFAK